MSFLKKCKKKLGKCIKKIKIVFQLKKEELFIRLGLYKKVQISIADLLMVNTKYSELLRYDIIVRYLALEEYFGKNDIGFSLYTKMQNSRVKQGYADEAIQKYKNLIESYEKNGYDEHSYIIVDNNLNLIDGSHRMALGLYYGIDTITAYIVKSNHPVEYSIDWFFENKFTTTEIQIIHDKAISIINNIRKPFSCIIWAPAVSQSENIIYDLGYYGTVVNSRKYSYDEETYISVVRKIYSIDDIEEWKIEKKLEHMKGYTSELVAVDVIFDNPEYRIKDKTGLPLSKRGERTKKALRSKYRNTIDNYFFDIVLHIGDNIFQSEFMRAVLNEYDQKDV